VVEDSKNRYVSHREAIATAHVNADLHFERCGNAFVSIVSSSNVARDREAVVAFRSAVIRAVDPLRSGNLVARNEIDNFDGTGYS